MERMIKFLFIICIIINSDRVRVTSGREEEECSNATGIIKQRHRMKRQLAFQPGTRIMFRVNTKDNIIKINQIYAHGFGFRGNIDLTQPNRPELLPSSRKRRSLSRREVYETLEELINQHGLDGRSCVLKMICDALEIGPNDGMLNKIFKLIFTRKQSPSGASSSGGDDTDYPMMNANDCHRLKRLCPLHLLDISPYTDI